MEPLDQLARAIGGEIREKWKEPVWVCHSAVRPHDFDLDTFWEGVLQAVERWWPTRGDRRPPFRVITGGTNAMVGEEFARPRENTPHNVVTFLQDEFAGGATIRLAHVERALLAVADLGGHVARVLHYPVEISAWATPENGTGVKAHSDDAHYLWIQIYGDKIVFVAPSLRRLPLVSGDPLTDEKEFHRDAQPIHMEPGSVLNLSTAPHGHATAGPNGSVHMTVGPWKDQYLKPRMAALAAFVPHSSQSENTLPATFETTFDRLSLADWMFRFIPLSAELVRALEVNPERYPEILAIFRRARIPRLGTAFWRILGKPLGEYPPGDDPAIHVVASPQHPLKIDFSGRTSVAESSQAGHDPQMDVGAEAG